MQSHVYEVTDWRHSDDDIYSWEMMEMILC